MSTVNTYIVIDADAELELDLDRQNPGVYFDDAWNSIEFRDEAKGREFIALATLACDALAKKNAAIARTRGAT